MKIVSLLPSATEIVCALGLEDQLVGITHECDFPASIADRPALTASRISHESMSSKDIDHAVREKQVNANLRKGKLLEEVFKANDLLWNTDQGKSFLAFWEFLLSQNKQDELSSLLEMVSTLPEVQEVKQDDFLDRIKIKKVLRCLDNPDIRLRK